MQAADDAEGDRALEAIGAAEGDGPVAHLQGLGIPQGRRCQGLAPGDAHHRQIGDAVTADDRAIELASIGHRHLDRIHLIDHVGIGEHQTLGRIDDHPRPLTPLPHAAGRITEQIAQQRIKHGRIKGLAGDGTLGVDAHHRGCNAAGRLGDKAVAGAIGCGLQLQRCHRQGADQAGEAKNQQ